MDIRLSTLAHTWLIDVDGTVLAHNGHLLEGDRLLPGVQEFWQRIPVGDVVILLSARKESERTTTLALIEAHGLRYDQAIFGLPTGERILINDSKPGGLVTALAVAVGRDAGLARLDVVTDPAL